MGNHLFIPSDDKVEHKYNYYHQLKKEGKLKPKYNKKYEYWKTKHKIVDMKRGLNRLKIKACITYKDDVEFSAVQ